ncbi:type 12 methyltransferase [Calothrix sp. NIES-4071]|nr:type 12 methyltransferase [Calothrix sp. NIES-4071]BAZ61940.1 type 12 methyltransferase [Calothrix sp. NIES-4105]
MPDIKQIESNEYEAFHSKKFFNEQWKIYQKLLDNNYIRHQEMYSILHELLVSYFQKPFKMLDLGCGDASLTVDALLNTNIVFYQGIDLSVPALEIAKKNMARIQCHTTFTKGDFSQSISEFALEGHNKFDAILMSFALHHLHLDEKCYLIEQLQNLLLPNGVLILIDIVRKQEEDRETYIQRYLDIIQKDWLSITPEEYSIMANHISSNDFPETQHTFQEISQKYGFALFECLYRDSLDITQMLCMYNAS